MHRLICFGQWAIILMILSFGLYAQTAEIQEARLQEALKAMNRMEHEKAVALFQEVALNQPYHPLGSFGALANRWIVNQGKYGYRAGNRELLEDVDAVIIDFRRRLVANPDDAELKYYIGLCNGLRARVLLAEKDWIGVLVSGYRIIRNFKSVLRDNSKDPDIVIAFGVFNYYVGLSSGFMKIASWIMHLSGSKEEGLQQIEFAALKGNYCRYEARSILAYLNLYFESDYPAAKRWLDMLIAEFPENPYYNFLYAEYNVRTGNPDIDIYLRLIRQRLDSLDPFFRQEYVQRLRLLEGSQALLQHDLDRAEGKLLSFLEHFDSEMDYDLASAYLRLGQLYDLRHERQKAREYYQKTVNLDNRSAAVLEAKKYLDTPYLQ